jgi:hypothetical protein
MKSEEKMKPFYHIDGLLWFLHYLDLEGVTKKETYHLPLRQKVKYS